MGDEVPWTSDIRNNDWNTTGLSLKDDISKGVGGARKDKEISRRIGAGKVLAGMAKRIAPDAESLSLNTPEDLEAFAKSL